MRNAECGMSDEGTQSFCNISWFNLVDLDSQAEAVAGLLRHLTVEQKLAWLRQQGEIVEVLHPLEGWQLGYGFISPLGMRTSFRFTEGGELVIVYDHNTRVVPPRTEAQNE
jgi:hypothetical protein